MELSESENPDVGAAVVASYDVEGARERREMADIADFAAELLGAPLAAVAVMRGDHQHFLSTHGTDLTGNSRALTFCTHFEGRPDVAVVPDATVDERFRENPLVTGDMHLRFYAGANMVTPEGHNLGTVCVYDTEPRAGLTPIQEHGLQLLAKAAMGRLHDRRVETEREAARARNRARLAESELKFRTLADAMPQMVWSTLSDGFHDYFNARWYQFTGMPEGSTDGEAWNGMFHPEDQERAWSLWRRSLETGEPYEVEYRLRHRSGRYRWVLGRALPVRDAEGRITRWFGTCTDVHEQKLAMEEREVVSQELSHRIKNIFSVISGLITLTARGRPAMAEAAADLRERITALGRAHDHVRPHSARSRPALGPDSLHGLLAELFAPYGRIRVEGDEVAVDDRSATPLALLFHELATNASKYGALSAEGGEVVVTVAREGAGDKTDRVRLRWTERGGPPVTAPTGAPGFGTQLVELSAIRQLGGAIRRDWNPAGLVVEVDAPLTAFSRG
ncbi:MAG TPA: PAS domain-containing protein [Sphingomonas sp.]